MVKKEVTIVDSTRFQAVFAMLFDKYENDEKAHKFGKYTYVSYYENVEEFLSETNSEDTEMLESNFHEGSLELLNEEGFVVIEESGQMDLEIHSPKHLVEEYSMETILIYRDTIELNTELDSIFTKGNQLSRINYLTHFRDDEVIQSLVEDEVIPSDTNITTIKELIESNIDFTMENLIDEVIGYTKEIPKIKGKENFSIIEIIS